MNRRAKLPHDVARAAPRAKTLLRTARHAHHAIPGDALGPIDPCHVVEDVFRDVRDRAALAGVPLVAYCDCGRVWLRRASFAVALLELVQNAIHASHAGQPVIVDVHGMPDNDVLWQIQDTGSGLSELALAKLGEREHVGPSGVERADLIVQRHGGLLRFESALGLGTTASIWLPAQSDYPV